MTFKLAKFNLDPPILVDFYHFCIFWPFRYLESLYISLNVYSHILALLVNFNCLCDNYVFIIYYFLIVYVHMLVLLFCMIISLCLAFICMPYYCLMLVH